MTDVFRLPEALAAWGTADFISTLKREIEAFGALRLVLAQCLNGFGAVDDLITVMVLGADDGGEAIEVRMTLLYLVTETAYCCPVGQLEDKVHGACEMMVRIDKTGAEALFIISG